MARGERIAPHLSHGWEGCSAYSLINYHVMDRGQWMWVEQGRPGRWYGRGEDELPVVSASAPAPVLAPQQQRALRVAAGLLANAKVIQEGLTTLQKQGAAC